MAAGTVGHVLASVRVSGGGLQPADFPVEWSAGQRRPVGRQM